MQIIQVSAAMSAPLTQLSRADDLVDLNGLIPRDHEEIFRLTIVRSLKINKAVPRQAWDPSLGLKS